MSPWLHVLVPAYGPSPHLPAALASLARLPAGEVLLTVVDDGSPGPHVADAAAAAGVECVRLPENLGISGAFNRCAGLSRGRYTLLMGSDDLVEPWYAAEVRSLVDRFDSPALAMPWVTVVDGAGREVAPLADRVKGWLAPRGDAPRLLWGDRLAASLLHGNWLYLPAIAWRTDVLRRYPFRADLPTAADLDVVLRAVLDGGALAFSPRRSFRYRRHAASFSSRTAAGGGRFGEERALFADAARRSAARGWPASRRAARWHLTSRAHAGLAAAARLAGQARGPGRPGAPGAGTPGGPRRDPPGRTA